MHLKGRSPAVLVKMDGVQTLRRGPSSWGVGVLGESTFGKTRYSPDQNVRLALRHKDDLPGRWRSGHS
jgi:hypothetical protein